VIFKRLIAITILLCLLFQTFSKLIIVADYYTNTAAFAKNCINKTRPKMHCNGKCQMMKKLQEEEKKEQQNTERKAEFKNEIISSKSFYATIVPASFIIKAPQYFIANEINTTSMPRSLFHPPGMA
jgi:hypothetical protein